MISELDHDASERTYRDMTKLLKQCFMDKRVASIARSTLFQVEDMLLVHVLASGKRDQIASLVLLHSSNHIAQDKASIRTDQLFRASGRGCTSLFLILVRSEY